MENRFDIVIESEGRPHHYWREMWRFRGLLFFLAWRDILVRYKQTVIGIAWSVLRPLITMLVFTLIFGKIAKLPSDGDVPYPLLVFAALLPWQLFANAIHESSNSLLSNANMLSKVYFPRLLLPASAAFVSLVDFLISMSLFVILMLVYGFMPGPEIVFLPIFIGLAVVTAMGLGIWLSALNVKYRDFRYIVPFLIQLGLYISPVGFSSSAVPERWRLLYSLNPMVGVIDGFRWSLLGGGTSFYLPGLVFSIVLSLLVFSLGIRYFRQTERYFADQI